MKMTVNDLYKQGSEMLEEAGRENAGFDARCLVEYLFGMNTTDFMLKRNDKTDFHMYSEYMKLIRRRATGEPLQYILGKWEFMDSEFFVGEGVLIPRPETELLVEFAQKFLEKKENPVVFDLCSGTGCIAISVAKLFPDAKVYALEKFDVPFDYLEKNIRYNCTENVIPVKGDLFNSETITVKADLILSNPPYIRSDDIPYLQQEVRREPVAALDGGKDGYDFYRAIAQLWIPKLQKDGAIAVECAEDQADEISQMFFLSHSKVNIINDLSGFPRVVTAVR